MKGKVPYQSVSSKLEVYNFPSDFCGIPKLEKVLIAKRLLFKKVTIIIATIATWANGKKFWYSL